MKISIITVCYNSEKTITDTIDSVARQTYSNKEHIVIDGASNDSTMAIVKTSPSIFFSISEKDRGIYDAMNKGIAFSTGEIIGTLNADDFYANNNILEKVAELFSDNTIEACYGDLVYVRQDNVSKVVRYWKSNDYKSELFKSGWMPAHPTFFVRKSVYERLGAFSLDYKIAADFELLFRFIEQHKIKTMYLPIVMVKMRLGGTTNKNLSNIVKQNKEIISILKKHYPDFSTAEFFLKKLINRFVQFVYRKPKV